MIVSEKDENNMGSEAFKEIIKEHNERNNPIMESAVLRVGENISKIADKSKYQWKFIVINSNNPNAFCLPGGKIVVYSGLFKYIKNDGELATVIGHEIGHAIARHAGERMSHAYLETFGSIAVDTTLSILGLPGIFGSVYGVATHLGVDLPYSRFQEYEADYIGLMLMAKAGYNPSTSIMFWKNFSKESTYGAVEEFFATHPMSEKRIKELTNSLKEAEKIYKLNPVKLGIGDTLQIMN